MIIFRPMFDREAAIELARRYDSPADGPALEAGAAIATGDFSQARLRVIFRWKTGNRGKSRIEKNTKAVVEDALRLAVASKEPQCAIAVLMSLHGVQVPVASAIMTAIRPDEYTVIDFRALEALGAPTEDRSIDFYVKYLAFCREQAREWGMSLRDFDRALWQWSKDRSPKESGHSPP